MIAVRWGNIGADPDWSLPYRVISRLRWELLTLFFVADVRGDPVVPLFAAHVGGEFVADVCRADLAGPQPECAFCAAGDDESTIRAERDAGDGVGVPGERYPDRLPGVGVP